LYYNKRAVRQTSDEIQLSLGRGLPSASLSREEKCTRGHTARGGNQKRPVKKKNKRLPSRITRDDGSPREAYKGYANEGIRGKETSKKNPQKGRYPTPHAGAQEKGSKTQTRR